MHFDLETYNAIIRAVIVAAISFGFYLIRSVMKRFRAVESEVLKYKHVNDTVQLQLKEIKIKQNELHDDINRLIDLALDSTRNHRRNNRNDE